MLDVIAALEWLRGNITRFGGDPDTVMVFGESGGGQKTSMLLGSPPAKGLFHRAAIQSGPNLRAGEAKDATEMASMLMAGLGIKPGEIDKLQQMPAQQLLEAVNTFVPSRPRSPDGTDDALLACR